MKKILTIEIPDTTTKEDMCKFVFALTEACVELGVGMVRVEWEKNATDTTVE